jgi:hypothetical protein
LVDLVSEYIKTGVDVDLEDENVVMIDFDEEEKEVMLDLNFSITLNHYE